MRLSELVPCVAGTHASDGSVHLVVVASQSEQASLAHYVPKDDVRVLGSRRQQSTSRIETQRSDRRLQRKTDRTSGTRREQSAARSQEASSQNRLSRALCCRQ